MPKRRTDTKSLIMKLLRESEQPLGAYEIIARLSDQCGKVAPTTVYRALSALIDDGRAHRVESKNAYMACQCAAHETIDAKDAVGQPLIAPNSTAIVPKSSAALPSTSPSPSSAASSISRKKPPWTTGKKFHAFLLVVVSFRRNIVALDITGRHCVPQNNKSRGSKAELQLGQARMGGGAR